MQISRQRLTGAAMPMTLIVSTGSRRDQRGAAMAAQAPIFGLLKKLQDLLQFYVLLRCLNRNLKFQPGERDD